MEPRRPPIDEFLGAEPDMGGPVPEGGHEPIDDLTGAIDGKPLEADGRPRNVATQSLEARAPVPHCPPAPAPDESEVRCGSAPSALRGSAPQVLALDAECSC